MDGSAHPGPELDQCLLPRSRGAAGVAVVPLRVQRGLDVDELEARMLREVLVPVPAIEGLDQGIVARLPG